MGVKEEHQQVIRLLRDTVTLLCKNGLKYKSNINVEGLIGVTVDDDDVFLVSINDAVKDGVDVGKKDATSKDKRDSTPSKSRKRDKGDVINLTDDDDSHSSDRRSKRSRGNDDVIVVREEPMSPSHRIAANQAARQNVYGRNAQVMGRGGSSLAQIRPRFPQQQYYRAGQQMYGSPRGQYPFRSPSGSPQRGYFPQMGRGGMINQQQMQAQYMARMQQQQMGPGRPSLNKQMMNQQMAQQQQFQGGAMNQAAGQQIRPNQFNMGQQSQAGQQSGQFNSNAAAGSPSQLQPSQNVSQTVASSVAADNVALQVAPVVETTPTTASELEKDDNSSVQPQVATASQSDSDSTSPFPAGAPQDLKSQNGQSQRSSSDEPFPTGLIVATQIVPMPEGGTSASETPVFSPLSDQPKESPASSMEASDSSNMRDTRADLEQLQASLEELQATIERPPSTQSQTQTSETNQSGSGDAPVTTNQPLGSPASQAGSSYSHTSTSHSEASSDFTDGLPRPGRPKSNQSDSKGPQKKRGRGRPPKRPSDASDGPTRRSTRLEQVGNSLNYTEDDSEEDRTNFTELQDELVAALEQSPSEPSPQEPLDGSSPQPDDDNTSDTPEDSTQQEDDSTVDDKSKIATLPSSDQQSEPAISEEILLGTVEKVKAEILFEASNEDNDMKPSIDSPESKPVLDGRIVQAAVLKMKGPIVALKTLEKTLGVKAETIKEILDSMTYPDHHINYVGQTVSCHDAEIFFKCPPQCLHPDAIHPYSLQPDVYKNFYCQVPEETKAILQPWYSYVEKMIVDCPFSCTMFPLDHLGLDEKEVRRLVKLKGRLEELAQQKAGAPKKN